MTGRPVIEIINRSRTSLDTGRVEYIAGIILERLGYVTGELVISLVPVQEMTALNRDYTGREGSTDVLTFPLDDSRQEAARSRVGPAEEVPQLLGDIVICPEVAAAQAAEMGHDLDKEICLLVIHGLLHLAGFDHEADAGEMDAKQSQIFEELCQ